MASLLIATSHFTYKHPLYSRNRAMVEFLQRKNCLGFSKVTVLYPDKLRTKHSPEIRKLSGCLEEIRFSLGHLHVLPPAIEPTYAASKIIPFFKEKKLQYDYCIAADLTGWQIAYPLRRLNHIGSLIYDDQDYFPSMINDTIGRLTTTSLEKFIAKKADAVVSASETLALIRRRQGASDVHVIPNGVDPAFFTLKDGDARERLARKTIVYAGYLSRHYGVNLLLDAFSQLTQTMEAFLVLAGSGPLEQNLGERLHRRELDHRVRLLGGIEHAKLADILRNATLGVAPYLEGSSASYGVPIKIKEYLAVGLPVVASAVGEIPQFLEGRRVGIATGPRAEELAEAMREILSLDPSEYRLMSDAGRKLASEYSWDHLFTQYFRIIQGYQ